MSASIIIKIVRAKLKISREKFANRLGLKTGHIIWSYEKKKRFPSQRVWFALIDIAKEVGVDVTLEDMRELPS